MLDDRIVPLPVPTPEQVQEFKALYLKNEGKELTDKEAYDYASRALQLVYLSIYCQPYKDGPDGAGGNESD